MSFQRIFISRGILEFCLGIQQPPVDSVSIKFSCILQICCKTLVINYFLARNSPIKKKHKNRSYIEPDSQRNLLSLVLVLKESAQSIPIQIIPFHLKNFTTIQLLHDAGFLLPQAFRAGKALHLFYLQAVSILRCRKEGPEPLTVQKMNVDHGFLQYSLPL